MKPSISIFYVAGDFVFEDFTSQIWDQAEAVTLTKYWSGESAPANRHVNARLLWTDAALLGRFDCRQHEPLNINQNAQTDFESEKLWERDVCEIFVAPDKNQPKKYFEFEVAPTGEWLDYAISFASGRRETDTNYNSGISTVAQIYDCSFSIIFSIKWEAFGKKPQVNDEWLGNLFRCVGIGATRGYLAWQPTLTKIPNFHVPKVFGSFKFILNLSD